MFFKKTRKKVRYAKAYSASNHTIWRLVSRSGDAPGF